MRTEQEVRALVGQTFGQGKMQRTVTRIEGLRKSNYQYGLNHWAGEVFWKRPGSKERSQSTWLPSFLTWMEKAERESDRHPIRTVMDIERYLLELPAGVVEGFISVDGNETTIVFTVEK